MDAATGGNLKFFVDVPAQTISQGNHMPTGLFSRSAKSYEEEEEEE
jgi:hypothetical protein